MPNGRLLRSAAHPRRITYELRQRQCPDRCQRKDRAELDTLGVVVSHARYLPVPIERRRRMAQAESRARTAPAQGDCICECACTGGAVTILLAPMLMAADRRRAGASLYMQRHPGQAAQSHGGYACRTRLARIGFHEAREDVQVQDQRRSSRPRDPRARRRAAAVPCAIPGRARRAQTKTWQARESLGRPGRDRPMRARGDCARGR